MSTRHQYSGKIDPFCKSFFFLFIYTEQKHKHSTFVLAPIFKDLGGGSENSHHQL